MAQEPKFLLGRGEKLTKNVPFHSGFGASTPPYDWESQRKHLGKQLASQQAYMDKLPKAACPYDQAVSVMTLHPQYYSRSMFPESLLSAMNLRLIGSMPVQIRPRAGRGSDKNEGCVTTAMFIAGSRKSFRKLSQSPNLNDSSATIDGRYGG